MNAESWKRRDPAQGSVRSHTIQCAQECAQRLLNLEAMRNWNDAALQETWREPAHDQEIMDAGVIIRDLRMPAQD